ANAHRVGLFQHSSFLGGGAVACAGELQVIDGKLVHITNKSGHYHPQRAQMLNAVRELVRMGVSLAGVGLTLLEVGNEMNRDADEGGAQKFYDDHINIEAFR